MVSLGMEIQLPKVNEVGLGHGLLVESDGFHDSD